MTAENFPAAQHGLESADRRIEDRLADMDKNMLGMFLFLGSEVVFFALLIIAYIYYHGAFAHTEEGSRAIEPIRTFIFSIFLFASSFTVWMASRSLANANQFMFRVWLLITVIFGAIFLIGQITEYQKLLGEGVTVNAGLFGTSFYTLTGFHGFHVFIGLIALGTLFILAMAGVFKSRHSSALETVSLYWHFVDIVWVFIFSLVYIWSYLTSF